MPRVAIAIAGLLSALLAGCSGGGQAGDDAALTVSDFVELDLVSMELRAAAAPGDQLADAYRDRLMLLRRIDVDGGAGYIGVSEVSQRQWERISGEAPGAWRGDFVDAPADVLDAVAGARLPQVGVSAERVAAVLAGKQADGMRLVLPSAALWRSACLAGATTRFSWGDGDDVVAVAPWAVTLTGSSASGPQDVGSRRGNAWGLRDMHGNAWEMVGPVGTDVELLGGAWDQPALQCQVGNASRMPADEPHLLVGFRIVLLR